MGETLKKDVCIIGAGAAGMMAAITAADAGAKVLLLEHGDRAGRKILSTGNGKCNLSHTGIDHSCYHGSGRSRVDNFLKVFSTDETVEFFEGIGLFIRERDGYLYPYSETAVSVLDALCHAMAQRGISLITGVNIQRLRRGKNGIFLIESGEDTYEAPALIVASGGMAAPVTGSDGSGFGLVAKLGVNTVKSYPALVKVKSDSRICKMLDGVRAKGIVSLIVDGKESRICDRGEIQFTRDGLSGIPIFNISGETAGLLDRGRKVSAVLDMIPDFDVKYLTGEYMSRKKSSVLKTEEFLSGLVNRKIQLAAMKKTGTDGELPARDLTEKTIRAYVTELKNMTFNLTGVYGFENAQVSTGGVSFDEVNDRLEDKKINGLYFAGEILDIDGICGGYNLQWSWTSGYITGINAAKSAKARGSYENHRS